MSGPVGNPEEARRQLIRRSADDEELRQRLLADPKGTAEEELGAELPEGIEIRVVEESADTIYLVLPPKPATSEKGGELSDRELESVAGGWGGSGESGVVTGYSTVTCSGSGCGFSDD